MNNIVPHIGASGFYDLLPPFNNLINPEEQYTCKAVRTISDYISNNEDIKSTIYDANGIPPTEYQQQVVNDIEIISLQSDLGHWIYVPVVYIAKLPDPNGVIYRTGVIGVSLPLLPADLDLTHIHTAIKDLIVSRLGVIPAIKSIETSKPILITEAKHTQHTATRLQLTSGDVTDSSRVMRLQNTLTEALAKISELEGYILLKHI